ncbi:MAG: ABC transporter substrate-binding protein [Caldilineaceae bacterium]
MFLKKVALLSFVLILLLGACAAPMATPAPAEEAAAEPAAAEPAAAADAASDSEARYNEILQCVEENLPASTYMTNDLLPDPEAAWEPMECASVDKIRVGMPWVLNDEEAPWYNAIEKGYYADVCLEVELVPGGPGVDHLQTLAGGAVDIAVAAGGSRIPAMVYSPTPAEVVAIGAFLKHSPYIWMGLDPNTPQDQQSTLELKPEDFIGKKVGLQGGSDYLFEFLAAKYNLPKDQITIMEAGFTPDPLLVGAYGLHRRLDCQPAAAAGRAGLYELDRLPV